MKLLFNVLKCTICFMYTISIKNDFNMKSRKKGNNKGQWPHIFTLYNFFFDLILELNITRLDNRYSDQSALNWCKALFNIDMKLSIQYKFV